MVQILNFFLDKPDKLSKAFLLIIQLLMTIWLSIELLKFIDVFDLSNDIFVVIWEMSFLNDIGLFNVILYLLFLALLWQLTWNWLPALLLLPAFNLFRLFIKWIILTVFYSILFIVFSIKVLLNKLNLMNKPVKLWRDNLHMNEYYDEQAAKKEMSM